MPPLNVDLTFVGTASSSESLLRNFGHQVGGSNHYCVIC
ncbi:putative mating type pheromone precursor [Melampsora larici-populina 98AG31]|uniref:Putative mating type pheromone n=1 Tax=Melampsora larici-populina (strain 98AG31 / pathotype 3-4-7) TaxID=747676 RepID=F4SDI4_MELLP|nr:putative mating type pheromone precursor [Melampsora larici-populina 98AG31]EGF97292.1 putative mating type pheromone precursor [Melampsora larici-populina 98AG31]